jgi:beta-galactosidase
VWEWIDHGLRQRLPDGRERFAYGGEFGEPEGVHGGNFVTDGLVFPDRTPSPGLIELKKVIEPVRITGDAERRTLRVENLHDFRDLGHLTFSWSFEVDGVATGEGSLDVPAVTAGAAVEVLMPALPRATGEAWLTVRGTLAADTSWAPRGHEVAWGQVAIPSDDAPPGPVEARAQPVPGPGRVTVGPGVFDARTGTLLRLGDLELGGPRLDVWRAPTDNDIGRADCGPAAAWRRAGLNRMEHRVDGVELSRPRTLPSACARPTGGSRKAPCFACSSTWCRRASGSSRCPAWACC